MNPRPPLLSCRRVLLTLALALGMLPTAAGGQVIALTDFQTQTQEGWQVEGAFSVAVAAPGKEGSGDYYLRFSDTSNQPGEPALRFLAPVPFLGNLAALGRGCENLTLEFDLRMIVNPGSGLKPSLRLTRLDDQAVPVLEADFRFDQTLDANAGWVHFTVPLGLGNGGPPTGSDGTWEMRGGAAPSQWDDLLRDVGSISMGLDISGVTEEYGLDNVQLSAQECHQACTPEPWGATWWPLDEAAGPVIHGIGTTPDGTYVGAPTPVAGQVGRGLAVSPDNHARVPDPSLLDFPAGQDFSIDLWVKTTQNQGLVSLLEKRDALPSARGFHLWLFGGELGFQMATGSGSNSCSFNPANACTNWLSGAQVADGEWHLVAVTVDRDGLGRFYVDGEEVGIFDPALRSGSLENTGDLLIGQQAVLGSSPLDGTLDEIEVFRRVLAPSEIEAIWQAGTAGKCKEMVTDDWDTPFCADEQAARAEISVCNRRAEDHAYSVAVEGLPAGDLPQGSCTVPGPTDGLVIGGTPVVVRAGSCRAVEIQFGRPPGLGVTGTTSCFRARVTNQETGDVSSAVGSLVDNGRVCTSNPPLLPVRPAPSEIVFDLRDTGLGQATLPWTLEVFGTDMAPDEEAVSLDGAAAGVPASGVAAFDAAGRAQVAVEAAMASPRTAEALSAVLFADTDGDGEPEALSSTNLLPTASPCVDAGSELCLNEERFRVAVTWKTPQGDTGTGRAVPLTDDTGYFWFFRSTNVELVLKVLDGRPVNDHFWVFYGALSNVEYEITVTDTETGFVKTYLNPAGELASRGDTTAIPVDGAGSGTASAVAAVEVPHRIDETAFADPEDLELLTAASHGCTEDASTMCLNGNRFQVRVEWTDFFGNTGVGHAEPLTSDTGYFWFFRDSNVELVVKVLDGRAVNGHWWVFYGALSNVAYTVEVIDTLTDNSITYTNPERNFASVGDTTALSGQ